MMDDECGAIGRMLGRETKVLGESSVLLCPPQIPNDLTQATAVLNKT
jgi:hypothetical protein